MADAVTARPFGVRFNEAIDNLKSKLPEGTLAWDSLAGPVHGKVFAVAGATSTDLVRDIQQAVVDAKANGSTITDFRKDWDTIVQRHGWTYNGKRGWRTRVVFDANMRSATMAGRWAQLQANADRRPFLQYRTAGDARVRPQHRQWNGRIYPISDAFWSTHYPPNGWGCRCTVRAYGQAEMEAKGLQVSQPFQVKTRAVLDRDGALVDQVPVGIDPGWDHNVGQSWLTPELSLGRKLASLPRELQGVLVDKTISPAFQTAIAGRWKQLQTAVAAGTQPAEQAQLVGFLDSTTLDGLARSVPDLQVQSTAVLARVGKGLDAWPQDWIDNLPIELRNYRTVLWDQQDRMLVVVPDGRLPGAPEGDRPVIRLQPNVPSDLGPAFRVDEVGTRPVLDLGSQARYTVLSGRVR